MNVCIIGDGLTSLSLAKNLINKKVNVHIYQEKKIKNLFFDRTIGVAKKNLEFFKKEILEIPLKKTWSIKKIEIYSEKLRNKKILNFENNNQDLFYMVKNNEFYELLNNKLSKSKLFKRTIVKKDNLYKKLLKENKYDLIINCDPQNFLSKKYFSRKINKDYYNIAYTTVLKHEKIKNNIAIQIFTKFGPIAFLPISNNDTSIVCSLEVKEKEYTNDEVIKLITINNPKYKIKEILNLSKFKLKSSNLRNYHYKNVLAFGDLLHRIHPLAGQGFNMTIRDIKILSEIIDNKIDLGIQLDALILDEFEKKTKHLNFIFSNGIDFIYELFNFDKKTKDQKLNKILKIFGKNKSLIKTLIKFADSGLNI